MTCVYSYKTLRARISPLKRQYFRSKNNQSVDERQKVFFCLPPVTEYRIGSFYIAMSPSYWYNNRCADCIISCNARASYATRDAIRAGSRGFTRSRAFKSDLHRDPYKENNAERRAEREIAFLFVCWPHTL